MKEHLGIKVPLTYLDIFASACRPASVIRTRTTAVCRPSAMTKTILVETVTRKSAVQKIMGYSKSNL